MIERNKFYFLVFCITFWVLAVGNFIIDEFLPVDEGVREYLNTGANFIFLLLGIATLRKKSDIFLILSYILLGAVSSVYNDVPSANWLIELRRYVPVLLTLPVVRYFFTCQDSTKFRLSLDKQLKIFLILQAFCVTWQFIRYGAGDHGGGTLGNWNSGNISMCIILLSFYFISKNWDGDNYLRSLWQNRWYVILMFPVFLNETKVSFLLIAIYFILLYPLKIKSIGKAIIAIPFMLIIGVGLIWVYLTATDSRQDLYSEDFFTKYLTGGSDANEILDDAQEAADFVEELINNVDEGEWLFLDIPRFMKVGFILPVLDDAKGGVILGAGMGHVADFEHPTQFGKEHIIALFGTRMMIHYTLLPMGLLGLIWAFFWYKNILAFRTGNNKMAKKVKWFLLFTILLTFFYNEFFNVKVGCIVFYIIAFANTYKLVKPASPTSLPHASET